MQQQYSNGPASGRKRLAVVGRVSTRDQERYGTSLEDQARKGEFLARMNGMEVVDSRAYQGDESGAAPPEARPIMQRILADARAHKFDAICFHKIDRIARRVKYMLQIWDELEEAGVTIYVIEPMIDTSDIMGRLLRNVLITIAEFERDMIQERTSGGRKREEAAGAIYLPRGKFGYQYVPAERAAGVRAHVVPHPVHADVVRRMFALAGAGWSRERIATLLTGEGVPTPGQAAGHRRQSARWYESAVGYILGDPTYYGAGRRGRITFVVGRDGKRRRRVRSEGEGIEAVAYPALVSRAEHERANARGWGSARASVRTDATRYLFYGGMVRCATHNKSMGGTGAAGGRRYYQCHVPRPCGGRDTHRVPAGQLEDAVWARVAAALLDEEGMRAAAERLVQEAEGGLEAAAARKIAVAAGLARCAEEVRWINRELRQSGAGAAEIADAKREVYERQGALERERERLDAEVALARTGLPEAQDVARLCRAMSAKVRGADAATKRAVLEALGAEIVVEEGAWRFAGRLSALGLAGEPLRATESFSRVGHVYNGSAIAWSLPLRLGGALSV